MITLVKFLQSLSIALLWLKEVWLRDLLRRELQNENAGKRADKLTKANNALHDIVRNGRDPSWLRKDDGHRRN